VPRYKSRQPAMLINAVVECPSCPRCLPRVLPRTPQGKSVWGSVFDNGVIYRLFETNTYTLATDQRYRERHHDALCNSVVNPLKPAI
jgi:hypothetical protein